MDGVAQSCTAENKLTNANNTKAVELRQKRFGQQDKIADALMQSLVMLPCPSINADCLRTYSDRLETSIRGLESLIQSEETNGELIVPIIREMLPTAVWQTTWPLRRTMETTWPRQSDRKENQRYAGGGHTFRQRDICRQRRITPDVEHHTSASFRTRTDKISNNVS